MKSNDIFKIPPESKIHQQICSTDQSQNQPKLQVSNVAKASVLLLTKSDYQISLK